MTIANRVVHRGIGRAIDLAGDHPDVVYEAMNDVLENSRFVMSPKLARLP